MPLVDVLRSASYRAKSLLKIREDHIPPIRIDLLGIPADSNIRLDTLKGREIIQQLIRKLVRVGQVAYAIESA